MCCRECPCPSAPRPSRLPWAWSPGCPVERTADGAAQACTNHGCHVSSANLPASVSPDQETEPWRDRGLVRESSAPQSNLQPELAWLLVLSLSELMSPPLQGGRLRLRTSTHSSKRLCRPSERCRAFEIEGITGVRLRWAAQGPATLSRVGGAGDKACKRGHWQKIQFKSSALGVASTQVGDLASPSQVPLWARPWPLGRVRLMPTHGAW